MTVITRPMKAETVLTVEDDTGSKLKPGLDSIEWPMWCSPKLDGWRMLCHPTLGPVTQSFKRVANDHVHEAITAILHGTDLDGELYCVDERGEPLPYNTTQSQLSSFAGKPNWEFMAFDRFDHPDFDFETRQARAYQAVEELGHPRVKYLKHTLIHSLEEFRKFADWCIENGYEGVVLRAPQGPYKNGRSTFNQGWMLKWKPWEDAEGIIVGIEELMHNDNEQTTDLRGLSRRSSHKANLSPSGMAGYFILSTEDFGRVRCGGGKGFTHDQRRKVWEDHIQSLNDGVACRLIGQRVVFRYQAFGMKDKPRFPNLKGFRYD